jgi:hypothetical protein
MNDKHRIRYLWPFFKRGYIIKLLVLLLVVVVYSKKAKAQQALEIGEQLPAAAYQQDPSLQGKAFLLLFINSTCKNFQQQLKVADSLAKKTSLSILAVTKESPAQMNSQTREAYSTGKGLRWIMADRYWHQLFPHHIAPHLVWINPQAKVAAISHSSALKEENLLQFKQQQSIKLPLKADLLNFNPKEPLLQERYSGQAAYYSLVKPYLAGASSSYGVQRDSVKQTVRTYIINFPLYRIYLMAFEKAFFVLPNRLLWEVKDKAAYLPELSSLDKEVWSQRYAYCYESVLPLHTPDSIRLQKIVADLNQSLGLHTREEYRQVKVWVLQKTGALTPAKPQKVFNSLNGQQELKELRNASLTSLTSYYNFKPGHIPVLDETGYTGRIDLQLKVKDMEDLAAVNAALKPYQLQLSVQERQVEFIVFTETR